MLLLSVKNLKKTFVERLLFENVSFDVDSASKIGLIGANGCGKTTLFNIIRGLEPYDSGAIYVSGNTRMGVMEQHTDDGAHSIIDSVLSVFSDLMTVERELESINAAIDANADDMERLVARQYRLQERYETEGGLTYRSRAVAALLGLGFTREDLDRSISSFSGGEKNKVQLAKALLSNANLLLLDEPTNHLDIESVTWLENYLASCDKAFIVVSHDRYFLDKVTARTIELTPSGTHSYVGGYTVYMEKRSSEREAATRLYNKTCREIRRLQGVVDQQRRWGQERNFVTAESKLKQIERLKKTLIAPERDPARIRFGLSARAVSGNDVLRCEGIAKRYEGRAVLNDVSFLIRRGERVFLLGTNGSGKTTLLRIICGRLKPDGGTLTIGANAFAGYYDQTLSDLETGNTVLEEAWDGYHATLTYGQMRNVLAQFLFRSEDEINRPVGLLSGGEKARLQLLKLMMSDSNFLLLDEPTNHLDIHSRDALESALEEYEGTMLIVSHDRYLINKLADRILYLDDAVIRSYVGSYDDFREERERELLSEVAFERAATPESKARYLEKKSRQSAINRKVGEIERIERRISDIEAKLAALKTEMDDPDAGADYEKLTHLSNEMGTCEAELSELYERWAEAQTELTHMQSAE
ncbi:MAG: ABC-F family ATP-binding cassette domain-containing protein [Clostridia bacterium]|nr:ABC-F family ATP-binding cassette domain-containing protein [Clostridia bacterium]